MKSQSATASQKKPKKYTTDNFKHQLQNSFDKKRSLNNHQQDPNSSIISQNLNHYQNILYEKASKKTNFNINIKNNIGCQAQDQNAKTGLDLSQKTLQSKRINTFSSNLPQNLTKNKSQTQKIINEDQNILIKKKLLNNQLLETEKKDQDSNSSDADKNIKLINNESIQLNFKNDTPFNTTKNIFQDKSSFLNTQNQNNFNSENNITNLSVQSPQFNQILIQKNFAEKNTENEQNNYDVVGLNKFYKNKIQLISELNSDRENNEVLQQQQYIGRDSKNVSISQQSLKKKLIHNHIKTQLQGLKYNLCLNSQKIINSLNDYVSDVENTNAVHSKELSIFDQPIYDQCLTYRYENDYCFKTTPTKDQINDFLIEKNETSGDLLQGSINKSLTIYVDDDEDDQIRDPSEQDGKSSLTNQTQYYHKDESQSQQPINQQQILLQQRHYSINLNSQNNNNQQLVYQKDMNDATITARLKQKNNNFIENENSKQNSFSSEISQTNFQIPICFEENIPNNNCQIKSSLNIEKFLQPENKQIIEIGHQQYNQLSETSFQRIKTNTFSIQTAQFIPQNNIKQSQIAIDQYLVSMDELAHQNDQHNQHEGSQFLQLYPIQSFENKVAENNFQQQESDEINKQTQLQAFQEEELSQEENIPVIYYQQFIQNLANEQDLQQQFHEQKQELIDGYKTIEQHQQQNQKNNYINNQEQKNKFDSENEKSPQYNERNNEFQNQNLFYQEQFQNNNLQLQQEDNSILAQEQDYKTLQNQNTVSSYSNYLQQKGCITIQNDQLKRYSSREKINDDQVSSKTNNYSETQKYFFPNDRQFDRSTIYKNIQQPILQQKQQRANYKQCSYESFGLPQQKPIYDSNNQQIQQYKNVKDFKQCSHQELQNNFKKPQFARTNNFNIGQEENSKNYIMRLVNEKKSANSLKEKKTQKSLNEQQYIRQNKNKQIYNFTSHVNNIQTKSKQTKQTQQKNFVKTQNVIQKISNCQDNQIKENKNILLFDQKIISHGTSNHQSSIIATFNTQGTATQMDSVTDQYEYREKVNQNNIIQVSSYDLQAKLDQEQFQEQNFEYQDDQEDENNEIPRNYIPTPQKNTIDNQRGNYINFQEENIQNLKKKKFQFSEYIKEKSDRRRNYQSSNLNSLSSKKATQSIVNNQCSLSKVNSQIRIQKRISQERNIKDQQKKLQLNYEKLNDHLEQVKNQNILNKKSSKESLKLTKNTNQYQQHKYNTAQLSNEKNLQEDRPKKFIDKQKLYLNNNENFGNIDYFLSPGNERNKKLIELQNQIKLNDIYQINNSTNLQRVKFEKKLQKQDPPSRSSSNGLKPTVSQTNANTAIRCSCSTGNLNTRGLNTATNQSLIISAESQNKIVLDQEFSTSINNIQNNKEQSFLCAQSKQSFDPIKKSIIQNQISHKGRVTSLQFQFANQKVQSKQMLLKENQFLKTNIIQIKKQTKIIRNESQLLFEANQDLLKYQKEKNLKIQDTVRKNVIINNEIYELEKDLIEMDNFRESLRFEIQQELKLKQDIKKITLKQKKLIAEQKKEKEKLSQEIIHQTKIIKNQQRRRDTLINDNNQIYDNFSMYVNIDQQKQLNLYKKSSIILNQDDIDVINC